MAEILKFLTSPVGLIVVFVALTLLTGGKLDVAAIMAMIQKIINPQAAAEAAARKAAQEQEDADYKRLRDKIREFDETGDTEGAEASRKLLDRLIKRRK